jgi:saccharopine dehydrogenase-like NADP-dependent oxidoreductase
MAKHTALLLGCGTIGAAVARLLVADEVFSGVLIADKDVARTHQITTELGEKVTPLEADIHDEATVTCLAQGVSVVLNTVGPFTRHVGAVMRVALHAGVPYADINDEAEVLWEMFASGALDAEARQRGIPLIVGLGSSPGLTNIWARYLADQMDTVTAFRIAIAMNPYYRSPAVFRHRFSTHGGEVVVFRQGRWQRVPGFSEEEEVAFPEPVGSVRVHLAGHCEPVTLPRFFPGLQTVDMKAGFTVDTVNRVLHNVIRYGFTATEPLQVGATHIIPADFTAAFLSSPAADHLFQCGKPASHIARQVQAQGTKDGQACTLTMQVVMEADARVIAMPLAVAARLLVLGQVPRAGLLAPEALQPRPFLEVLERWGVRLHCRRETQTDRFL